MIDLAELRKGVERVGYVLAEASEVDARAGDESDGNVREMRRWLRLILVAWPLAVTVMVLTFGYEARTGRGGWPSRWRRWCSSGPDGRSSPAASAARAT